MLNLAWDAHFIVLLQKLKKEKLVWQMSKTFVAQFDDFVAFNCGSCWSCVGKQ
jgi:hypothetical protein